MLVRRLINPGGRRDQRELGRRADGDAGAEQDAQREQDRERVGGERHRDHHGRLRERDGDQQPAVLVAVDDPPGDPAQGDDRTPQADEHRGRRDRGVGLRADVQREQHPQHRVADGREADGADEQADVADPEDAGHAPDDDRGRAVFRSGSGIAVVDRP